MTPYFCQDKYLINHNINQFHTVNYSDFAKKFLTALQHGAVEQVRQILTSSDLNKISLSQLGTSLSFMNTDRDLENLEIFLQLPKASELGISYFENALQSASCSALKLFLTSNRATELSPESLRIPLELCSQSLNHVDVLSMLLSLPQAKKISSEYLGQTLKRACEWGKPEVVKRLLNSPIQEFIPTDDIGESYVRALELGHAEILELLVTQVGYRIKINRLSDALSAAAKQGNVKVFRFLLNQPISNIAPNDILKALYVAVEMKQKKIVKEILGHLSNLTLDDLGLALLSKTFWLAASSKQTKILQLFLAHPTFVNTQLEKAKNDVQTLENHKHIRNTQ